MLALSTWAWVGVAFVGWCALSFSVGALAEWASWRRERYRQRARPVAEVVPILRPRPMSGRERRPA